MSCFNHYFKPKFALIICCLSLTLSVVKSLQRSKIFKNDKKNIKKTGLKACGKTKNCLILNVDTHLYYETRASSILYGNQLFAENFYVAHLFLYNFVKFVLSVLFRDHFFHTQIKNDGIFFSIDGFFENTFHG